MYEIINKRCKVLSLEKSSILLQLKSVGRHNAKVDTATLGIRLIEINMLLGIYHDQLKNMVGVERDAI